MNYIFRIKFNNKGCKLTGKLNYIFTRDLPENVVDLNKVIYKEIPKDLIDNYEVIKGSPFEKLKIGDLVKIYNKGYEKLSEVKSIDIKSGEIYLKDCISGFSIFDGVIISRKRIDDIFITTIVSDEEKLKYKLRKEKEDLKTKIEDYLNYTDITIDNLKKISDILNIT